MIDLSKLSTEEFRQLEKEIEEHKKAREDLKGWKITFTVRYNPFQTPLLTKEKHGRDTIEEFMVNDVADLFIVSFNLSMPEDVSGCTIVEATKEEISW